MSEQVLTSTQTSGNMRWYVIHAYSGLEKSVGKALKERIQRSTMSDCFGQILIPTEEVVDTLIMIHILRIRLANLRII